MGLDVEPIYCAEQIVVPPDFADVLKAYTKEVIRRQPEDILEFSVAYFANLANVSRSLDEVVPPSYDQLKIVYAQVEGMETCSIEECLGICSQAGISSHHVVDVISAAGIETSSESINPNVVLMLLLATTNFSLSAVICSIFQSLGTDEQLSKEEFLKLFGYLVDADKSLPDHSVGTLKEELGQFDDGDFISYSMVAETTFLKELLKAE